MDVKALGGGQLRIGASDTICRYFLVPYLKEFHEHFPNVHIKVTNATSSRCVDLLENEQVDLVVTNFPNPRMNTISHIRKVREFHDVFIANEHFGHLKNKRLELEELLGYPILMLDKASMTSEFLHILFQQRQLDLVPEIELSSNDLLIDRPALASASLLFRNFVCRTTTRIYSLSRPGKFFRPGSLL